MAVQMQNTEWSAVINTPPYRTLGSSATPITLDDDAHLTIRPDSLLVIISAHSAEINVGERSAITFISVYDSPAPVHKIAHVQQDASLTWIDVLLGEAKVQVETHLVAAGASTKKLTVFAASQNERPEINLQAFHEAPHTSSVLLAKGIVNHQAKAKFSATINIGKNAAQSSGHQRADVLLLSENACCDAIPILDVENDEVNCSHAATISQLDEEQLFYVVSRGLDEEQARQLLLFGFVNTVLQEIPDETIRENILSRIQERL